MSSTNEVQPICAEMAMLPRQSLDVRSPMLKCLLSRACH